MSPRAEAAMAATAIPDTVRIGPFDARKLTGGDMLVMARLGFAMASGDAAAVAALSRADQMRELLGIGGLLCQSQEEVKALLWRDGIDYDAVRRACVERVAFALDARETTELIQHVARFFQLADAIAVEVEPKPAAAGGSAPEPQGKS